MIAMGSYAAYKATQTDELKALIQAKDVELEAAREGIKEYKAVIKILVADLYRISGAGKHITVAELTSLPKDSPGWQRLVYVLQEPPNT